MTRALTGREQEACRGVAGRVAPIVDRNRCEGKQDCVRVCPFEVFEMRRLAPADKVGMSLLGRLKAAAHGNRQAFVARPEACHACRLCVDACPERALQLASLALDS